MKKIAIALISALCFSQFALAADSGCDAKAADKKLNGAAKNSFIKKCEREAAAATAKTDCSAKADEKKLKGAARNSFTKKCEREAG